jgi:CRP-like cAMP-binding protein
MKGSGGRKKQGKMSQEDFAFLMNTDLLRATPEEGRSQLLYYMTRKEVKAGERIISQGEKGDRSFLIQHGSCLVSVEKEGASYPLSRLKKGDLLGETAILTGEKRNANVDAETDMVLWGISRLQFDELIRSFPDVREFLTELVSSRCLP